MPPLSHKATPERNPVAQRETFSLRCHKGVALRRRFAKGRGTGHSKAERRRARRETAPAARQTNAFQPGSNEGELVCTGADAHIPRCRRSVASDLMRTPAPASLAFGGTNRQKQGENPDPRLVT